MPAHILVISYKNCIFRLNPENGLHYTSISTFKESDLNFLGKLSLGVFETFKLVDVTRDVGEDKKFIEINNLTLINFVLRMAGPTNEKILTIYILLIQVLKILLKFWGSKLCVKYIDRTVLCSTLGSLNGSFIVFIRVYYYQGWQANLDYNDIFLRNWSNTLKICKNSKNHSILSGNCSCWL